MKIAKYLLPLGLLLFSSVAFAVGGDHHAEGFPLREILLHAMNLAVLIGLLYWLAGSRIRDAGAVRP